MSNKMYNILIVIDTSRASGRKFLTGVEKYLSAFANWRVSILPPEYLRKNKDNQQKAFPLNMDEIDGLIVRDSTDLDYLLNINKPKVINDTQRELIPFTSTIVTDSKEVGKVAADYFLGLGFKNFAYCGFDELPWSKKRFDSFQQTLKDAGIDNVYNYIPEPDNNKNDWESIAQWLNELPRPLCVFACNDDRAVYVLEACKLSDIKTPEEVAVLGVDNDELVCNLSFPPLSSIELDFEKSGFIAAQHIDQLIQHKANHKIIHVKPTEVINRQSTDILAIEDENVLNALIYIRENYKKAILTKDIVNATCISRRELEKRFNRYLKKSIKSEIDRLRTNWIKKKLLNSNESIGNIIKDIEFTDPEHFSRYFKNATGKSPSSFRKENKI